jgi:hypothetical protein
VNEIQLVRATMEWLAIEDGVFDDQRKRLWHDGNYDRCSLGCGK